jgi:FKBP-type peptidyl-prolyl cis-trans isomerase SlyD
MIISENAAVLFHYTLTDEEGTQLDSSKGKEPLAYLHGHKNIIPGLEQAMEGKQAGDVMVVNVEAADAYGEIQEQMIQEVPRKTFQADDITVGMRFEAQTPNGPVSVVVTGVTEETVTVDGNHPLAGKTLNFDVRVDTVREATEEELTHGHIHGAAGGHEH